MREKHYLARMDDLPNWGTHPGWAKDVEGGYAFFQAIQQAEESIRIGTWLEILKLHEKVQVARGGIEPFPRSRPE